MILDACSRYFAISRRDWIVLTEPVQNSISETCSIEAEIKSAGVHVNTRPCATYKYLPRSRRRDDGNKSPVYLLRLPPIDWHGRPGPGLLVLFGMSAPLTLAWAYLLRTRMPELLSGSRFVMAELALPQKLNTTPAHLEEFCGDWDVRTIFNLAVPVVNGRRLSEHAVSTRDRDTAGSMAYAARLR